MNKTLFSCCCILSIYSCFSMNSDVIESDTSRKTLRSSVISKINSIETNIDMMRDLNCAGIDKYIENKNKEMSHLIEALNKHDELIILASKIDSSLEVASELRGYINDEVLDKYIDIKQKEYENVLSESYKALHD